MYISHENNLNEIYNNTNQSVSYKINKFVFEVNTKFSSNVKINANTRKRKRNGIWNSNNFKLSSNVNEIKILYDEFLKLVKFNTLSEDENNIESLKFIKDFHKVSSNVSNRKGVNTLSQSIVVNIDDHDYIIPPNCTFFNNDIRNINDFMNISAKTYDFIVIDPPWWNKSLRRIKVTSQMSGYSMMTNDEICEIPIEHLININSIVIIWCTNAESHKNATKEVLIPKWNLKLLKAITWLKITKTGSPVTDFRGEGCKQPFEKIFIACHKDKVSDDFEELLKLELIVSVPSLIHSHKPPLLGKILFYYILFLFIHNITAYN